MLPLTHERGTTLLEAIVAASLLVTVATGTAALLLLAHRLGERSEQLITATTLAAARIQILRAVPWRYEIDGVALDVPELAFSPPDALERNTTGFWDTVDEAGQPVAGPDAAGASFVRRWAIHPVSSGPAARAVEVCVFRSPPDSYPDAITCLVSARTRQP